MAFLTEEQVAQLAPDSASLKAGRDLANERKWVVLAYNERVAWGAVQGSGSNPYKTQVDLISTAFKCSCPSRKFPCKHGLGLLFLLAKSQDLFKQNDAEPDWVEDWISKRATKKKETVAEPADSENEKDVLRKAKAKAKTAELRAQNMAIGVAEMDLLLRDWVRGGLLNLLEKDNYYFEKIAARMIDAQVSGLANAVRMFNKIGHFNNPVARQSAFLTQIVKLFLLTESYKNLDKIGEKGHSSLQNDIRTFIGQSQKVKEIDEDPTANRVRDVWFVLAKYTETEDDLVLQKQWLVGTQTQRMALILDFAYKQMPLPLPLPMNTFVDAELVFYPSVEPIRAFLKTQFERPIDAPRTLMMLRDWTESQLSFSDKIKNLPFLDELPQMVQGLKPVFDGKRWFLEDENGDAMPLPADISENRILNTLAISGGKPANFALLRSHEVVNPLFIVSAS